MISNPYSVLGISQTASDDEIKAAYRALAKKYHPDLNPGDEYAAQKMNEVNAAYDQIKKPQPQAEDPFAGYGGYSSYGYGSAQQQHQSNEPNEVRAARNYIRMRHFREAINALQGLSEMQRGSEWYYLFAIASYNVGNRVAALDGANRACQMSPGNMHYRQLLAQIEHGGYAYEGAGAGFGFQSINCDPNRICWSFCVTSAVCNFFGFRFCC